MDKMKQPLTQLLLIILSIIIIPNVTASFANEWGEYQDSPDHRGFIGDESGNFNDTGITVTIPAGSAGYYQPLAIDMDGDGVKEYITSSGNYLNIYTFDIESRIFTLQEQVNFNGYQVGQFSALRADFDDGLYQDIIVLFRNVSAVNATIINYNGTAINIISSVMINGTSTGVVCKNETSSGTVRCYVANNNGYITRINPANGNIYNMYAAHAWDLFTTTYDNSNRSSPIISDLDRDNQDELILTCDHGNDNKDDICVFDLTNEALDTTFSTDGIYDVPLNGAAPLVISGFLVTNIQSNLNNMDDCYDDCKATYSGWRGLFTLYTELVSCYLECDNEFTIGKYGGGDSEIVFTGQSVGGGEFDTESLIYYLTSDGTATGREIIHSSGSPCSNYVSPPIVMGSEFISPNSQDICVIEYYGCGGNMYSYLACYNDNLGLIFYNSSPTLNEKYWYNINYPTNKYFSPSIVAARMNMASDNNFDIVTSRGILTINIYNNDTDFIPFAIEAQPILVDMDNDKMLDVGLSASGLTSWYFTSYDNQPPELYQNFTYSGYGYDYSNPVCLDSSVTFQAKECYEGASTYCNYENDLDEDTERIVTNCGFNTLGYSTSDYNNYLDIGTETGINPTFSCVYNRTGTYSIRLYLQDDSNYNDYTQYNTQSFVVNVINGTAGVTCNRVFTPVVPGQPGEENAAGGAAGTAEIDTAIDSTLGILFGTSTKLKAIVGIGLVIGIGAGVAASTASGFAVAISVILGLILVTVIGLINAYVLILGLVGGVLMLIISKFVAGGREGSG